MIKYDVTLPNSNELPEYATCFHVVRSQVLPVDELERAINRLKREFPRGTYIGEDLVRTDEMLDYEYRYEFYYTSIDSISKHLKRSMSFDYTFNLFFSEVDYVDIYAKLMAIGQLKDDWGITFNLGITVNSFNSTPIVKLHLRNIVESNNIVKYMFRLDMYGFTKSSYLETVDILLSEFPFSKNIVAYSDLSDSYSVEKYGPECGFMLREDLFEPTEKYKHRKIIPTSEINFENLYSKISFPVGNDLQEAFDLLQSIITRFKAETKNALLYTSPSRIPLDEEIIAEYNALSKAWVVDVSAEFKKRKVVLEIPKGATPEKPIRFPRFVHYTKTNQIQVDIVHTGKGAFLEFNTYRGLKSLKKYLKVAEIDPIFWEGPPHLRWDGEGTCKIQ